MRGIENVAWATSPCVVVRRNFRTVLRANQQERSVLLLNKRDRRALAWLAGVLADAAEYATMGW
jgi:hypothetical protein